MENPTGSVFCAHGAGFVVNWDEVDTYAHIQTELGLEETEQETVLQTQPAQPYKSFDEIRLDQEELEEILVDTYAHIQTELGLEETEQETVLQTQPAQPYKSFDEIRLDQEELEEIFTRTYGPIRRERNAFQKTSRTVTAPASPRKSKPKEPEKEYLLVDGYNIIFAWEDLNELAKVNIEGARNKLMDILCNYQGYKKCTLILVWQK